MTVAPEIPVDADTVLLRYREWRQRNPLVYELLRRFALERREQGRRFGVKALFERVRWDLPVKIERQEDGWRLNNNYTAYVARDLIAEFPALEDLIETRMSRRDADTGE